VNGKLESTYRAEKFAQPNLKQALILRYPTPKSVTQLPSQTSSANNVKHV
ncbi:17722_t:CDS:1, partial [Racocetra fulgida]